MSDREENNLEPDALADVDVADDAEPIVPSIGTMMALALEETPTNVCCCPPMRLETGGPRTSLCNVRRLKRELSELREHPPSYCCVEVKAENLSHWEAVLKGPVGTVYEGGHFVLDIHFPADYPFKPPQVRFLTRIYHCNVDRGGTICLDVIGERWSPITTVAKVLLSIYLLMSDPNPNDPLEMYIANKYKWNRMEHDRIARYWTQRFAKPLQPMENEGEVPTEEQPHSQEHH